MDHRTTNIFEKMASSSLARSRAIAVLFSLPQNVHGSVFRENASVDILAADRKRSFLAAWTVMNNCRSQFGRQCAQLKGLSVVHVALVPPLLVPPLLVPPLLVPPLLVPPLLVPPLLVLSCDSSAVASSSGAGTDGATSTASRLLFSGLPSEVSSSPAVVVTQMFRILLVPATALSSRRFFSRLFAAPAAYKRGPLFDGHITMKLNKTHFSYCSRHNLQLCINQYSLRYFLIIKEYFKKSE